ncbi:MAG: DNA polymerase III subunit alpha [Firmicutes bacterium ADurb.Bin506]|jgi:DNA polymerase-3 subunit alpha|nr:MAG: DNA polymerase III subunit alpha [Firmicutes bacterium ADurb.Bin506]
MASCAITDHGCLFGAVEFYRSMREAGLKPIIGCEVYVAQRSMHQREGRLDDDPYHLILLAANDVGYANLMEISSAAYTQGFYYKPRVDKDYLAQHSAGLVALSACLSGEVPRRLRTGSLDEASRAVGVYRDIFGPEHFFLEVQSNGMQVQEDVNRRLIELARVTGAPLVATNDAHYLRREDARAHDVLLCIQTASTIDDPGRMRFPTDQFYLKSPEEMHRALGSIPGACQNTLRIAEMCNVELDFGHMHVPDYTPPEGETRDSYLARLCREGAARRYPELTAEIESRLRFELGIIQRMGYSGYFLIVWDFISFAKSRGIYVGPGRGSVPGSLVAYCLGITDIDPLKYGLLFERFLNPERVTMPDIDVDFCYERRGEVIEYVAAKYGSDRVAQIITFGTLGARAAIRDVGRALKLAYNEVDRIAKLVPNELNMTIDRALELSPELSAAVAGSPAVREMITMAKAVEGAPRHPSVHAAGVVISADTITRHVPLFKTNDGVVTTQYAMDALECLGILKMDFLGLRTLTVIGQCVDMIEQTRGERVDMDSIPLDDPDVYAMLCRAESEGVFQLESSMFQNMLREVKPTRFEDIVAIVALGRPGPMVMAGDFVRGKRDHACVRYPHPALERILSPTYGVMLYQEQVMQVASELAGFSLGEADMLRRAMGKKKPEVIQSLEGKFMAGARERGVDERVAAEVFSLIQRFAGYGFNKSHSAAYGLISYRTAYLRHHYFPEFMAATLSSWMSSSDRIGMYIDVCKANGVKVLPPSVNKSLRAFSVEGQAIRFGLGAVKNLGDGAVSAIITERTSGGEFTSLDDFCSRVDMNTVNRKAVESLIRVGAFYGFGNRRQLVTVMDQVCEAAATRQRMAQSGQASLFDLFSSPAEFGAGLTALPDVPEFRQDQVLAMEKELLGVYLSGHPLASIASVLRSVASVQIRDLPNHRDGEVVTVAGVVTARKQISARTGQPMAFVQMEDMSGQVEVIVFPRTFEQCRQLIVEDARIAVRGKLDVKEEGAKILADAVWTLPDQ